VSESIDVVARGYERFNSGELALELMHPNVRIVQTPLVLGTAGTFEGREGFQRVVAELREGFEDVRFEPESYDEVETGVVIVQARWIGRGNASGAPVNTPVWHVWTVEEGLITSLEVHASERAARAAAQPS
jgi:ketosteroid isomerase-like protein